ncbi:MAG: response regulator [Pseudomonadales bacterium]
MVVDDEPAVLEVLAQALETVGGYKVLCARDGRSALEQLKGSRVDLVLTDLHMPHMDGLQLIRHLVKDRWTIPIIAMSGGSSQREKLMDAQQLGARASLLKPIAISQLLAMVAEHIQP